MFNTFFYSSSRMLICNYFKKKIPKEKCVEQQILCRASLTNVCFMNDIVCVV